MSSDHSFETFSSRLREVMALYPDTQLPNHLDINPLALDLFQLQFQHNATFRLICEQTGRTPTSVSRWQDIPAVPTSAFKDWDVTCLPVAERSVWFCSSGTTTQRHSRNFHNRASLSLYEESLWSPFTGHLVPEGIPFARQLRWLSLTPPPNQAPHSSLIHMFNTVRARIEPVDWKYYGQTSASGEWELTTETILSDLAALTAPTRPVALLGTAFLFVKLLDEMARLNFRCTLPPGSRALETGGYKGKTRAIPKANLHAELCSRLGLAPENIVSEYGMAELSSQAYERAAGQSASGGFGFPPWARATVISPESGREVADGETGLLRILDLANVYSALSIQTEDLATRRGARFELIGRAAQAEPRGCSLMAS